jgi:hypothetical protein
MIIKTPIQELIYVLDFFNQLYKNDQELVGQEFYKYFDKRKEILKYQEKYSIIDAYNAGADKPFFFKNYTGSNYFEKNLENHE